MPGKFKRAGVVLLALISAVGCSSSPPAPEQRIANEMSELRTAVHKAVVDSEQARQLDEQKMELQRVLMQFRQQAQDFGSNLAQINADYDASDDEFVALFNRVDAERKTVRSKWLDIHYRTV